MLCDRCENEPAHSENHVVGSSAAVGCPWIPRDQDHAHGAALQRMERRCRRLQGVKCQLQFQLQTSASSAVSARWTQDSLHSLHRHGIAATFARRLVRNETAHVGQPKSNIAGARTVWTRYLHAWGVARRKLRQMEALCRGLFADVGDMSFE